MNIQNIPRSDKSVKRAFLPKLDAFLLFDYSAIEMRVLAFYLAAALGDYSLSREFSGGLDPHSETAKLIYPGLEVSEEARQTGKVLNFSTIYGGGCPTIMEQLGLSYGKARRLLDGFHEGRPGIRALADYINQVLDERGYIKTLWGRRLHPRSKHSSLNTLIQGCSADLLKASMIEVDHYLYGTYRDAHMVCSIHDEVIIDCKEREVASLVAGVPSCMRDSRIEAYVPIEVSTEITRESWADKVEYAESEVRV